MLIYEYIAFALIVFILVQKNHVSIIKLTYHKISSDKTQNHNLREDRLWFAKTTLCSRFILASVFEYGTYKVVQMRVDGIVTVISTLYIMPYVRHTVLSELLMIIIRCGVNNRIVASCCEEEQIRLFAACPFEVSGYTRCGADGSDITEEIRSLQSDEK